MAHWEQLEFVRRVRTAYPEYFRHRRVLEVGSGEIVDSVRSLFWQCDYLGVDVAPGRSVDRVCPGQALDEPSASFDLVISCECFEHNPYWRETYVNMLRMLRPGGLCIVSAALTGRQEHGTRRMDPGAALGASAAAGSYADYYENLYATDLLRVVDPSRHFVRWVSHPNVFRSDLYFVGLARGAPEEAVARFAPLVPAVRSITRRSPPGPARRARARLAYGLKRGVVAAIGERGYHEAKFRLRTVLRGLGQRVFGRERVEAHRRRRRAEKARLRQR